jgi:hypothetical protein
MKKILSLIALMVLATALTGCESWLEEERQANLQQCQHACSSAFANYPSHYTMCMNAGLQADGYYNGPACQEHIKPHLYCMQAGYGIDADDNSYADCVTAYMSQEADRDFIDQQTTKSSKSTVCKKTPTGKYEVCD